ncbi:uncharacterized protein OCT59_007896 [Rhizophagus irregularis]|uniref:uncharacterized protein n=1 Tax=Rhizophagus irregularis TaxID=588596 RepID=UPI003327852D|nr:hypothetical protein OCT59_007896 [Rhizophagus irregularis]
MLEMTNLVKPNNELNNISSSDDNSYGPHEQYIYDNLEYGLCPECVKPNIWNCEKQNWNRKDINYHKNDGKQGYWVILKSLSDSSKIDEDFLNEWKLHLQCQHNAWSNFTSLIPLFGITQNPVTKNYMVVMMYAFNGSLRNNLSILKYNPNDKFRNLWDISRQLNAIHSLNLVHGDFHDGNLLYLTENILGDRPEIIKGTMPEYVELMERCWDNEPEKRPTAKELANTFDEWNKKYPMEEDEEKRIPVPDNEPEIKCHPKSCSTSRIFVSSVKLNEILSGKTDILDEDLDNCMVTVIEHQL